MIKKIIFIFFLLFFFAKNSVAENYKIIATVNTNAITQIDIENEIKILKIINYNSNKISSPAIALNNLINEKLKISEIKEKNIEIDKKVINAYYQNFLANIKIKNLKINDKEKDSLIQKIKIDSEWNLLINKMYSWKISINALEIENKISTLKKNNKIENLDKIKEELIKIEKDKKIQIYSNYHLNKIKNKSSIKIYKWKKQLQL